MSDRAYWSFKAPDELLEWFGDWRNRMDDWTPVMHPIALDMESFVEGTVVPTQGEGEWQPMAQSTIDRHGSHPLLRDTGFMFSLTSHSQSKVNAAVTNIAPHAHFADGGVKRYQTNKYQTKGHRRSKAFSRAHKDAGVMHSPPRTFIYVDDRRAEELYGPMVLDFFFGELA